MFLVWFKECGDDFVGRGTPFTSVDCINSTTRKFHFISIGYSNCIHTFV